MAIRANKSSKQKEKKNDSSNHYRGAEDVKFTPMIELLPYKAITNDVDHFIVLKDKDDGYADMLSIRGQGVGTMSAPEQLRIIDGFHSFLQTALDSMKIIISPFPVDTSEQQRYWGHRYVKVMKQVQAASDPRRKQQLRTQLRYIRVKQRQNVDVEKKLVSEEFILVLFGKRKIDLRNLREACKSWGGKSLILEDMSKRKKEEALFRINNLNTQIK